MTQQPVQEMNYKDTLNLPQTAFKMKAGAATREPEIEAFWDETNVYGLAQTLHKGKSPQFILHDGPPYLSSDKIHIGTALNKILKDIITRYKTQRGYYSPYVPGYDGHGLPIENAVLKSIKGGRQAITPTQLRKKCRQFALDNLKGQERDFKRLGCWGNWTEPYITINAEFEATQIKLFGEMYRKNYVYKGLKPVYWCPTCETALADAEVEYADHTSYSIYVAFQIQNPPANLKSLLSDTAMVIWTTTPWTLPANLALSVHPEFEYVVFKTQTFGKLMVAKDLLETFLKAIGLEADSIEVLGTVAGADLYGLKTRHPFIERDSIVLTGTHVTLEAGTGIVHTAPGHGMEDYVVVQEFNQSPEGQANPLPILSPLDSRGVFTEEAGERFKDIFYEVGNKVVLDVLTEHKAILSQSQFVHSYPHCWRCHKPVIYRATEQWFINVNAFRAQALEAIRQVRWIPERGESRLSSMVENRTDWCISRQRVWGVPIPVFYCEGCRKEWLTPETIERIYRLFKQHTSDIWWEKSADEILEGSLTCDCGSKSFTKEMDIMDVWMDSGVTHTAVVEARSDELGHLPVELYLEGSDQHRGWFQSSLLTSVMLYDMAPYKSVLTHGFVLDQSGRKMSKSLGNVVDPQSVINTYGADILRLWVASVDYSVDVRIGQETINQLAEVYKKVRNTIRYILGNLADFDPATDRVSPEQLSLIDRYTLFRLKETVDEITKAFDDYAFHRFYQTLQNFCVVDLSSFYFDLAKDILYCDPKRGTVRRAIQTVLYDILSALVPLLVPVMPHMADDIWLSMPDVHKMRFDGELPASVTMAPWPVMATPEGFGETELEQVRLVLRLKELINKALEQARSAGKIGSSLDARILVHPKADALLAWAKQVDSAALLKTVCIASDIQWADNAPDGDILGSSEDESLASVWVQLPQAEKCVRCWKYDEAVGHMPGHSQLCRRCAEAVTTASS